MLRLGEARRYPGKSVLSIGLPHKLIYVEPGLKIEACITGFSLPLDGISSCDIPDKATDQLIKSRQD